MPHMNQERKKKLAANLKAIMPKNWKYSLSVRNHMVIVLTISKAPVDLIGEWHRVANATVKASGHDPRPCHLYTRVNDYRLESEFDGELLQKFEAIKKALNDGNHDRSDIQSDYFDVGWYVEINVGLWNKPFVCTDPTQHSGVTWQEKDALLNHQM